MIDWVRRIMMPFRSLAVFAKSDVRAVFAKSDIRVVFSLEVSSFDISIDIRFISQQGITISQQVCV